jgi:uncharacterized protein
VSFDLPSFDPSSFRPRFPWWGGDLQTVANVLAPPRNDPAPHSSERLEIDLKDGTGDRLVCTLDRPQAATAGAPLCLLVHGLTGSQESHYIYSMACTLLDRGYRVLRVNLRGAGPSRSVSKGHYYAGRSQDFRALLAALPASLTVEGTLAVGYSLGGAMLLKYLGEEGQSCPLVAAASVSAPIDLSLTCRNMMRPRNTLYHRHILGQMKVEALAPGAEMNAAEREAVVGARSVWDYDEAFIAPRHGFAGAEDYYERCKPLRFMGDIRVPTLVIAALDDPWIPGALYSGYDWARNTSLKPLLPRHGGHVGFHGSGSRRPWSDMMVAEFFSHGRN